eukprot:1541753-Prymnesium_polylepis.1
MVGLGIGHQTISMIGNSLSRFYQHELAAGKSSPVAVWMQHLLFLTPWATITISPYILAVDIALFPVDG